MFPLSCHNFFRILNIMSISPQPRVVEFPEDEILGRNNANHPAPKRELPFSRKFSSAKARPSLPQVDFERARNNEPAPELGRLAKNTIDSPFPQLELDRCKILLESSDGQIKVGRIPRR